jgi:hypothetical protein
MLLYLPAPTPSVAPHVKGTEVADRSTTFQPVEGGTEHHSGEALLVAAYAGLWVILLGWVLFQWTKQTALARRMDDLERDIAAAAAKAKPQP